MQVHSFVHVLCCGILCNALTAEDRLQELESVIKAQFGEYVSLKSRIGVLEEKVDDLKTERDGGTSDQESQPEVDNLAGTGAQLRELLSNRAVEHVSKRQSDTLVAFHAYMNTSKCVGVGNRFIFDVVSLDEGGGFAHDHSTYDVLSFGGFYVLTWTVAVPSHSHSKIVTELVVNTDTVVGVLTSDPDYNAFSGTQGTGVHPATGVVVVQLHQNDHVYIKVKQTSVTCPVANVIGDDHIVRTTFSGWKL